MEIHLVRHACAGRKQEWDGPDAERPLDPVGAAQAEALDEFFAGQPPSRVLSSPTRRCTQTVEPLARRHGLPVEPAAQLCTDVDPIELLTFVTAQVEPGSLLCTHGEVMAGLLPLLPVEGPVDEEVLLVKGGVWTLTIESSSPPRVTRLQHRMPSSLRACAAHGPVGPTAGGPPG